jgi:hypothetical protein
MSGFTLVTYLVKHKSRYPTKSFVGEVIDIVGTQTKVGVGVHLVNLSCKKIDLVGRIG